MASQQPVLRRGAKEICLHIRPKRYRTPLPEEARRGVAHGVLAISLSSCYTGHIKQLEIPGRLDGPTRIGNPHKGRGTMLHDTKPLECHMSRGTSEWHRHIMVSQFFRSSCQAFGTQGAHKISGSRQRRAVYGFSWPGQKDGSVGHPDVQGGEQLFYESTSHVTGDIGYWTDRSGMLILVDSAIGDEY